MNGFPNTAQADGQGFRCGRRDTAIVGFRMVVNEYKNNILTQGMQWPEYLFGVWLPVGCVVLGIRFIQSAIYTILGKDFDKE